MLIRPSSRFAFSLLEVMVAMAILAGGVAALLNGLSAQQQGRQGVRDSQRISALAKSLQERLLSEPWTGTTTAPVRGLGVASWCTPSSFDAGNPFSGGHTEGELLATGILAQPSGLKDLRYYVEYYRADTLDAGHRGLLDKGVDANSDNIYDGFTSEQDGRNGIQANLALAQRFTSTPTSAIEAEEPLAIRIVIVWRGGGVFGAQRLTTGEPFLQFFLVRGGN